MTDLRRPDDEALIAGALRGDEEALGHLLARDQEWAYNVAYRVLGQEADARDAVQDAFLLTVRALRGDGSPPRSIETYRSWLRRVVSNAAITQIRRRPGVAVASAEATADSVGRPGYDDPGRAIEREETRAQVLQALLSLPETQRVALALRELLDASYDEIAEVLDLPRTAVGTLLFRARAGFRAAYDRVLEQAPPLDCPDVVPLFASIVDDQPRPDAWLDLEAHLRACDRCQGELVGQRRARRLYALLPLLALPAGWDPVSAALQSVAAAGASVGVTSGASAGVDAAAGEGAAASAGGAAQAAAGGDPATGATAGETAAAASSVATQQASGSVASAMAGSAGGSASGGLFAGGLAAVGTGTKLALAALATAAVVGVATVAGSLAGPGADPTPAPSSSPAVASSPAASPGLAPTAAAGGLSGSEAGSSLATAVPVSPAPAGTVAAPASPQAAGLGAPAGAGAGPTAIAAAAAPAAAASASPLASPGVVVPGSPSPRPTGSPAASTAPVSP